MTPQDEIRVCKKLKELLKKYGNGEEKSLPYLVLKDYLVKVLPTLGLDDPLGIDEDSQLRKVMIMCLNNEKNDVFSLPKGDR
ncbi:hypothetical protein [Niallia taxi]|uniref:hypothetical protein n=1 Tax=Niallia taxi TaxID=2499688 RepID=UPI0015F38ADB|nr:hypothetical protein [Niallia taxi]